MPTSVRPLVVGLTGNIGAGKSSAARMLAQMGAVVVDADDLARQATEDEGVLALIASELGEHLVDDGRLDRQALAQAVFNDSQARSKLNAIVHPWVGRRRVELEHQAMQRRPTPPMIVHDVPLLFEVGLDSAMDVTVVVTAPLALRARRVARRSGLTSDEVRARDAAQMPQEEKARRADFVISNAGGEAALKQEVARLWPELLARRATG